MARRDDLHFPVRRALEKDGWTITHDPLRLVFRELELKVDLAGWSENPMTHDYSDAFPPTKSVGWSLDIFSPESHQRSWWIVHTRPARETAA